MKIKELQIKQPNGTFLKQTTVFLVAAYDTAPEAILPPFPSRFEVDGVIYADEENERRNETTGT